MSFLDIEFKSAIAAPEHRELLMDLRSKAPEALLVPIGKNGTIQR